MLLVYDLGWGARLLPGNASPAQHVLARLDAGLVQADPGDLVARSRAAAACPPQWLPYLAAERSADEFDGAWPEERRRAVIAGSFAYHRKKGTRAALAAALAPLNLQLSIVEWFENASEARLAYTFRLRITLGTRDPWDGALRGTVVRLANSAKNAHTLLEGLEFVRELPPAPVFVGGFLTSRRTIEIAQEPRGFDLYPPAAYVFVGLGQTRRRTLLIKRYA